MFKTQQMISKFYLNCRTDVESYFLIGQLHVTQIHRPISVLTLCNFTFFIQIFARWYYLPQNCSGFINRKKTTPKLPTNPNQTILGHLTHWTFAVVSYVLAGNSNQLVFVNGTCMQKSRSKIPALVVKSDLNCTILHTILYFIFL